MALHVLYISSNNKTELTKHCCLSSDSTLTSSLFDKIHLIKSSHQNILKYSSFIFPYTTSHKTKKSVMGGPYKKKISDKFGNHQWKILKNNNNNGAGDLFFGPPVPGKSAPCPMKAPRITDNFGREKQKMAFFERRKIAIKFFLTIWIPLEMTTKLYLLITLH